MPSYVRTVTQLMVVSRENFPWSEKSTMALCKIFEKHLTNDDINDRKCRTALISTGNNLRNEISYLQTVNCSRPCYQIILSLYNVTILLGEFIVLFVSCLELCCWNTLIQRPLKHTYLVSWHFLKNKQTNKQTNSQCVCLDVKIAANNRPQ